MPSTSGGGKLRAAVTTVLLLLCSVASVSVVTLIVVTTAPDGVRDLRAYQAAGRCPAAPSAPAECRWTQEFTVSGVHLSRGRNDSFRVLLTGPDGARWRTSYSSGGPLLYGIGEGDRVTGTIWRGLLTEIASGDVSQKTLDAPADMRARVLVLALIVIPAGLLLTAACVWRLCRLRAAPTPGMVATGGLAAGLLIGTLFCLLLLGDHAENPWWLAGVWAPMAALLTIVARVYVNQKRAAATASD
ncbi:hypothetical protein OG417_29105 [Actinoallomurus sp. NBC_01490]|uniref:hypothetical protein n=1 Tax=Actinoallomurus sp. NBC_01490 TaxID=2903557 RepID=UPI002E32D5C5|nr:hypothetical protein [Actinoallomurus sp. NBC_01490]